MRTKQLDELDLLAHYRENTFRIAGPFGEHLFERVALQHLLPGLVAFNIDDLVDLVFRRLVVYRFCLLYLEAFHARLSGRCYLVEVSRIFLVSFLTHSFLQIVHRD